MTGLIAFVAGFSAVCACLWLLGEVMDWLDRRHGVPSCVEPVSHVRLLSDLDRWRSEISDVPVLPRTGTAGAGERVSLPDSPSQVFPAGSRTNVSARSTEVGAGRNPS